MVDSLVYYGICVFSEADGNGNLATTDSAELFATRRLESLHLTINLESGALLPLALRSGFNVLFVS